MIDVYQTAKDLYNEGFNTCADAEANGMLFEPTARKLIDIWLDLIIKHRDVCDISGLYR